jgi:hypothetical protein
MTALSSTMARDKRLVLKEKPGDQFILGTLLFTIVVGLETGKF